MYLSKLFLTKISICLRESRKLSLLVFVGFLSITKVKQEEPSICSPNPITIISMRKEGRLVVEILNMQNPRKENSLNKIPQVGYSGFPNKISFVFPPKITTTVSYLIYILASLSFQTHIPENLSGSLLSFFPFLHPVEVPKFCGQFFGSVSNSHLIPGHLHPASLPKWCFSKTSLSVSLPSLKSPLNTSWL